MTFTIDKLVTETEYFNTIVQCLLMQGQTPENLVEDRAHGILDAFVDDNGDLDVDALDNLLTTKWW